MQKEPLSSSEIITVLKALEENGFKGIEIQPNNQVSIVKTTSFEEEVRPEYTKRSIVLHLEMFLQPVIPNVAKQKPVALAWVKESCKKILRWFLALHYVEKFFHMLNQQI